MQYSKDKKNNNQIEQEYKSLSTISQSIILLFLSQQLNTSSSPHILESNNPINISFDAKIIEKHKEILKNYFKSDNIQIKDSLKNSLLKEFQNLPLLYQIYFKSTYETELESFELVYPKIKDQNKYVYSKKKNEKGKYVFYYCTSYSNGCFGRLKVIFGKSIMVYNLKKKNQ